MADSKAKKNKHIFLLLRITVVIAGIIWGAIWVSTKVGWDSLASVFGRMNLWVFAAVLVVLTLGHIIVGFRWWLLLRTQSIFIDLLSAIKLYFVGWFYNNFMPSSVGGDLIRAWYVTKHTDRKFEAALSVFVDRAIGLLTTFVIAAFFYLLFLRGQNLETGQEFHFFAAFVKYKTILVWTSSGILVVLLLLLLHKRTRIIMQKGWSRFYTQALKMLKKLRDAVVIYGKNPLSILAVFAITVLMQIMIISAFWFLGRSLGIDVSIKYYYVFFTLTWVLGAIPISIGGAVVVEFTLAYLFINFAGVAPEAAGALALCQRAVWVLTSLPGAAIHLTGMHLPKNFSIDYSNDENKLE